MSKEENGKARDIINQWMQIAIWIVALMVLVYVLWIDENVSFQSTMLNVSALLPLFLLTASLLIEIGGYTVRGFILAKEALRERRERIQKEKIDEAISPLAWRVATRFMDEHETELGDRSDSDLLEMVKEFGSDKALDIAAADSRKDILEFVNSIDHERRANRISVNISELMTHEDFANYVISLVQENQDMHIA